MASKTPTQPSKAGIVTDSSTGQRHIPSSTRADGSTRREIKIRPGYRPPEDVEVYRNRTAEAFRTRGKGAGVPGADTIGDDDENGTDKTGGAAAANNKNAKRREARRKAKAAAAATAEDGMVDGGAAAGEGGNAEKSDARAIAAMSDNKPPIGETMATATVEDLQDATAQLSVDAGGAAETEKKIKRLKKKLREARELQQKKERGEGLLPEQLQKALRLHEILRELDQLGYNEEDEPT